MSNVLPFRPRQKPAVTTGAREPSTPICVTIEADVLLSQLWAALKAGGFALDYDRCSKAMIIRCRGD